MKKPNVLDWLKKFFDPNLPMICRTTWQLTVVYWKLTVIIFFANIGAACFAGSTLGVFGLAIKVLTGEVQTTFSQLLGTVGRVADRFVGTMDRESLFFAMIILALITVFFNIVFRFCAAAAGAYLNAAVYKDVWNRLFQQFMTMEYAQINRYKVGDLNRYVQDASGMSSWLRQLNKTLGDVLTFLVYGTLMLVLSWKMSVVAFVMLSVFSLLLNGLIKKIRVAAEALLPISIEVSVLNLEYLNALRLLRIFRREAEATRRMTSIIKKQVNGLRKRAILNSLIKPIMQTTGVSAVVIIIFVSYYWFGASDKTIWPRLLTFLFVLNRMNPLVSSINSRRADIHNAYPLLRRLNTMLRTDNKRYTKDGVIAIEQLNHRIEFNNISLRYLNNERYAVKNVSFRIPRGKMIAIVGESGGGKSSTADLLLRLYDPQFGKITVDGIDLRELRLSDWRNLIGVVSQDTFIFNASIRENIAFGKLDATESEIVHAARNAHAHDFISELSNGYDTIVGDRGYRLSGGQRQRIAIARAIIRSPEILLLDEATSSLDSHSEMLIHRAINEIRGDRTVLAIAHRLSTIRTADYILVMNKGEAVEQGTHEELLSKNGYYATMWRLQSTNEPVSMVKQNA